MPSGLLVQRSFRLQRTPFMRLPARSAASRIVLGARVVSVVVLMAASAATHAAERFDRGLVAFPTSGGGVYVGWRLLAEDPRDVAFDVYRSDSPDDAGHKLNATPIGGATNFVDAEAPMAGGTLFYRVRAVGRLLATRDDGPVSVDSRTEIGGYRRIKLQGNYGVQKVGLADLDGDGKLDFIVKQPDFNTDPAVLHNLWKPSPETYKLEAYRHDGTFLWRHDMGHGIETGVWYSPFVVYDLDGDGKAEVYSKAGPEDPMDIVHHEKGMVIGGPEFLAKLDGATGRELARIPWPTRDGIAGRSGPDAAIHAYSRQSRNLLGIAYLDGKRPHLIVERGTYSMIKIRAYDPNLHPVWSVDTTGEFEHHTGQGTHGMQVADIDGDGRDEIVIGAAAIDDDGKPLWSTRRGHPDACYVGHIDPVRAGMQIYFGHELAQARDGLCLVDARTGETIWGYDGPTIHIHSNGMVADIDPTRPGMEIYGGEANGSQFWLYDARGTRIGNKPMGGLNPIGVWWDGSPTKLVAARGRLFRFKPPTDAEVAAIQALAVPATAADVVRTMSPVVRNKVNVTELWPGYIGSELGKIEGNIVAIADCLGDWREEIIVSLLGEIRIYSTTIPAATRRVCLVQDRQYRTSVARQTMGYLYPPILGRP